MDAGAPAFCCCEFVDRRGRRSHLSDAGACDACCNAIVSGTPQPLRELLADLDDRLRLPMWGGALYLGVEGLVPFVAVPLLGKIAARSLVHTCVVFAAAPAVLAAYHHVALRFRRRSRFFVAFSLFSLVYMHFLFTTRVADSEDVWFGWWVASTVGHATAVVCAIDARRPPPTAEDEPLQAAEEAGLLAMPRGEELLFGRGVVGYDHHCIWIDACVGAHNRRQFLRGLLAFLVAAGVSLPPTARQLGRRHGDFAALLAANASCFELVWVAYAALAWLAVAALVVDQAQLIARGVTSYEARCLRRSGKPLPPWPGVAKAVGAWVGAVG